MTSQLIALVAEQTDRITLFIIPGLERCWNGIPCPGSDDGFNGDDVIFCTPPSVLADVGSYFPSRVFSSGTSGSRLEITVPTVEPEISVKVLR